MPHTIYSRTPAGGHYGSCGSCGVSCGCAPCKAQYGAMDADGIAALQKKVLISVPVLLGVIGFVMYLAVKLEN